MYLILTLANGKQRTLYQAASAWFLPTESRAAFADIQNRIIDHHLRRRLEDQPQTGNDSD